jgi:hypothetical protein
LYRLDGSKIRVGKDTDSGEWTRLRRQRQQRWNGKKKGCAKSGDLHDGAPSGFEAVSR